MTYARIYEVIRRIPRGRVATYGQIAGAGRIGRPCTAGGICPRRPARHNGAALASSHQRPGRGEPAEKARSRALSADAAGAGRRALRCERKGEARPRRVEAAPGETLREALRPYAHRHWADFNGSDYLRDWCRCSIRSRYWISRSSDGSRASTDEQGGIPPTRSRSLPLPAEASGRQLPRYQALGRPPLRRRPGEPAAGRGGLRDHHRCRARRGEGDRARSARDHQAGHRRPGPDRVGRADAGLRPFRLFVHGASRR